MGILDDLHYYDDERYREMTIETWYREATPAGMMEPCRYLICRAHVTTYMDIESLPPILLHSALSEDIPKTPG
jgi:hypothetical protein